LHSDALAEDALAEDALAEDALAIHAFQICIIVGGSHAIIDGFAHAIILIS
jgi:hypothetical protein